MRRHAKASSPFGNARNKAVLALAMACALLLTYATGASAALKYYDSTIGTSSGSTTSIPPSPSGTAYGSSFGTSGGGVGDIAVNDPTITTDGTGQSGWIYVVDRGNNRIQAFDQNKNFQFAIGRDVVASKGNEAQSVAITATGGTFTLTFGASTTGPLAFNVSSTNLRIALEGLASIGAGNVTVAGGTGSATGASPYVITFTGASVAAANQPQITVDGAALTHSTGTPSAKAATTADGFNGGSGDTNEKQSATIGGSPSGGTFTLTFGANTTAGIAFNATAAEVKAALEAIASVGAGNAEVTGPAGGPYAIEFIGTKASVDQAQMTANASGLTPSGTVTIATTQDGASFEKCVFANQCKVGTTTATATLGNAGTFAGAMGMDIDQATGNFFVREANTNARVQQFTATGAFIRAFGWDVTSSGPGNDLDTDAGGPDLANQFETCNVAAGDVCKAGVTAENLGVGNPGQFGSSTQTSNGLAVAPPGAPNAGQVYVADPFNCRIQRFTVPTSPTAAVTAGVPFGAASPGAATPSGADQMGVTTGSRTVLRDVVADKLGVVYGSIVPPTAGSGLRRFDTTSNTFLSAVSVSGSENLLGDAGGAPSGVEIDPATDHVLLSRTNTALGIVELDLTGKPQTVSAANVVDRHATDLGATVQALGAGRSPARYFISTSSTIAGTGTGQRVLVLDDTGVDPPPTVTLLPPSEVTGTSAALQATVNPNGPTGFPTSYKFQVSKNGANWTDVGSNALVGANGDGASPVTVSQKASGLDGNTLYRVRLLTSRPSAAGAVISSELIFLTDKVKPEVTTLPVQGRGSTTATLYGSVRPNGLPTSYYFEWGKTTAYERGRAPIPDGQVEGSVSSRFVQQNIDGLFPASTFHYRLVASNAEGTTFGNDMSVETRPTSAAEGERAYEMVTPPFKATRLVVSTGDVGDNARTGLPSLDGDAIAWSSNFFPLSDDVRAPHDSDRRIIRRTADGWVNRTQNTLPLPPQYSPVLGAWGVTGSSGDLRTFACCGGFAEGELIPTTSAYRYNRLYTLREGTGSAGYTAWASNLDTEVDGVGLFPTLKQSPVTLTLLNDDGSAMARWGSIRGMARLRPDPLNVGRMVTDPSIPDPSLSQQLPGEVSSAAVGGAAPYLVRAAPDALPNAPRDLISGCTGTTGGGDATQVPMRDPNGTLGFGAEGDDYLGSQECVTPTIAPQATGSGDLSDGSLTISNVSTSTGAFEPGQVISGIGIPQGTKVVAAGAGTITMSAAAKAVVTAPGTLTAGSKTVTSVTAKFLPGQILSGAGIPAGATVVSRNERAQTMEISQAATASGSGVAIAADAPAAGAALTAAAMQLTSSRGAVVGAGTAGAATALSNDGNRVFFQSPDPEAFGVPGECTNFTEPTFQASVGPLTNCPTQLYVRQYDDDGNAFVRWVSRPQGFGSSAPAVGTGTLTAGSDQVTGLVTATGTFTVGQPIRGNGIADGTTILAVGAGVMTLSGNATASGALTTLASGAQQIGQVAPVGFQGASRDGGSVYFKATSPLLPSDPNNGASTTTGAATSASGDLYRYDLPASRDTDPSAGSLTRITAGPNGQAVGSGTISSGSANVTGLTTSSGTFVVGQKIAANGIPSGATITAVGAGTLTLSANASASGVRTLSASADPNTQDIQPLRFLSDDGKRAYFITSSPIAGADQTPPKGGVTTPTGTSNQTTVRNLYVYDGTATGQDRYKFIAALPYGAGSTASAEAALNRCATRAEKLGNAFYTTRAPSTGNCFRGTPSGNAVVFFTAGSLTADDTELSSGDIYLYDIRSDELTRITAQPSGVTTGQSYACFQSSDLTVTGFCHGILARASGADGVAGEYDKARGWGGMRYENIVEDSNGVISVYFETPLQFLPEDTNSTGQTCSQLAVKCHFWDVYQWRDGEYSLISPGNSDDNSWFSGNSVDGRDVFFLTSARIDPREIDDADFDIYDARIGGGFPYTSPATPCDVLAHECRGAVSTQQQPDAGVTSAATGAADNAAPAKKKAKTKKKAKKKKKKSKAKQSARNHGSSK